MQCWVVQKILPLYVGNDLPVFRKNIAVHLQKCAHCRLVYHQYQKPRNILQSLKTPQLSPNFFEGYWDELYRKIQVVQKPQPSFVESFFSLRPLWRPAMAVFLLVVGLLLTQKLWIPRHAGQLLTPQPTAIATTSPMPFQPIIPKKQLEVLLKYPETMEYRLDQVEPLSTKNVSF